MCFQVFGHIYRDHIWSAPADHHLSRLYCRLCIRWSGAQLFFFTAYLVLLQVVASDGVRAMMESALTARDRVGVQDFVLLENYTSEAAFIENLRKRFKENLIYVSSWRKKNQLAEYLLCILNVQECAQWSTLQN